MVALGQPTPMQFGGMDVAATALSERGVRVREAVAQPEL
jgi:hypothetical protein